MNNQGELKSIFVLIQPPWYSIQEELFIEEPKLRVWATTQEKKVKLKTHGVCDLNLVQELFPKVSQDKYSYNN